MKHNNNSSLGAKLKPQQKWNKIHWVKVEKFVLRLERSIAKAVEHHDFATVAKLRRIFRTSNNVRLLSVRKVTQDNRGKRTAFVYGKVITSEKERWQLASNVSIDGKSNPLLRVWIPKSNSKATDGRVHPQT
jgi:RNA-directed DNA polymerase